MLSPRAPSYTLAVMNTMSHIHSLFFKKCPYCGKSINIRKLRKIPYSAPLRWYQFTPAPKTACPECGGFVKFTAEDSKILLVGFGTPIAVGLAGAFFPVVRNWITLLPGGLNLFVLPAFVSGWYVLKHSELAPARNDR